MRGAVFGGLLNGPLRPTEKRKYQVTHCGISHVAPSWTKMHVYWLQAPAVFPHFFVVTVITFLMDQGTNQTFVFTTIYGEPRLFRPTGKYWLCKNMWEHVPHFLVTGADIYLWWSIDSLLHKHTRTHKKYGHHAGRMWPARALLPGQLRRARGRDGKTRLRTSTDGLCCFRPVHQCCVVRTGT